ncbi:hypothetical protein ACPW96_20265 [Micromonospora sp. DT81.3]
MATGDREYEIEVTIPEGASKAQQDRLIDKAVDEEVERIADALVKDLFK